MLKRYLNDQSGHFAIWTALLALPIISAVTFAIDLSTAQKASLNLSGALDAAALAAVSDQALSDDQRKVYAEEHFRQNFDAHEQFQVLVQIPHSDRLEITANGASPVSVSRALGVKEIAISETSIAEVTREHIICVLTLNPDGAESFSLFGGAVFNSPNCAVQVNSSNAEAAYVDRTSSAIAKDFCVTGGAVGSFMPYANTQCAPVKDPYENTTAPVSDACIDLSAYQGKGKFAPASIGDNVILNPGTYCANISLNGANVTLSPGTYILEDSEIWMRNGASITANNVTIVLRGADSMMFVEKGSNLHLKAPETGPLAGLAIFQDAAAANATTNKMPTGTTELTGGSTMNIVGTVYVPTQTIEVWGKSAYDNTSPATSYIGYNVSMGRDSSLSVNVDHEKAGLPPILPRSDEGARLVR